jgi:hypothetical protein
MGIKSKQNYSTELGVVVYVYNSSTWDTEAKDQEFETSLDYKAIPCLKKKY